MVDFVAALGAVSGVLALALSLVQELRHHREDRPSLRVSAQFSRDVPVACLVAVNAGKRPIRINRFFVEWSDGRVEDFPKHVGKLPQTLSEGQDAMFGFAVDVFAAGTREVAGFYFVDSLGNAWPLAYQDFLDLQGLARAALEEAAEAKRLEAEAQARALEAMTPSERSQAELEDSIARGRANLWKGK